MSFLSKPAATPSDQSQNVANWPFSMKYGTEGEIVILNSLKDSEEYQVNYVKSHMMKMKSSGGKPYTKRVLCPDYKRDLETEDSICPRCKYYASLSKDERKELDWTLGYKSKQELPMSILYRYENEDGEMVEERKVRFSSDNKENWDDEFSKEQTLITEALEAAKKSKLGKDIRGLTFKVKRANKPPSGISPAAVGELSVPMSGISYFKLDKDNPEHQPYSMEEIIKTHYVTEDVEEILSQDIPE